MNAVALAVLTVAGWFTAVALVRAFLKSGPAVPPHTTFGRSRSGAAPDQGASGGASSLEELEWRRTLADIRGLPSVERETA